MRKNFRTFLAFALLLTNFSLNTFTQLPNAKAVTGCADSKGTVSETTSGGSTSLTVTSRRSGYANARSTLTYP